MLPSHTTHIYLYEITISKYLFLRNYKTSSQSNEQIHYSKHSHVCFKVMEFTCSHHANTWRHTSIKHTKQNKT